MTGSDYGDAVAAFLEGRSWRTASSQVRPDTTLVRGVRADADGEARLVALAVSGADARVTEKHVQFLLQTASDDDADAALVSTPGGLTADARALVDEYSVDVVDAERIERETDWRPDGAANTGAGGAAGDAADAQGAETPTDETPEPTDATAGTSDVRSEVDRATESNATGAAEESDTTTAEPSAGDGAEGGADGGADDSGDGRWVVGTEAAGSESADSASADSATDSESTDSESTASAQDGDGLFGGSADDTSTRSENQAQPSGFGRRDVVKLGGVAIVGVGGWVAYTRTGLLGGGTSGPEQVVRDFYAAIDDGDAAAARALVHENAVRTVGSLDPDGTTVEITSLERASSDADDVARFRVTLRVDGRSEQTTVTVERNDAGEWRMMVF